MLKSYVRDNKKIQKDLQYQNILISSIFLAILCTYPASFSLYTLLIFEDQSKYTQMLWHEIQETWCIQANR